MYVLHSDPSSFMGMYSLDISISKYHPITNYYTWVLYHQVGNYSLEVSFLPRIRIECITIDLVITLFSGIEILETGR